MSATVIRKMLDAFYAAKPVSDPANDWTIDDFGESELAALAVCMRAAVLALVKELKQRDGEGWDAGEYIETRFLSSDTN